MTLKFKKVLITGGAGCIGMPLCKNILEKGTQVVLFDLYEQIETVKPFLDKRIVKFYGSILDKTSMREAMEGCDAIIHLAAHLGVGRTEKNKLRCLDINIDGTKNLLEVANMNGKVKKIIFASSSEVYGEPIRNPINENDITQGKTVYAISKLAGEELVKAYSSEYSKFNYTILRYFNTYGPHQIAQFVIPRFINNVLSNKSPIIYGNGLQKRSYNFSEDTARATADSLFSSASDNQILNIGNSLEPINLIDLAKLIIKICKKENDVNLKIIENFKETDRDVHREIYKRYCDTSLAKEIINYEPRVSLKEGIKRVVKVGIPNVSWAASERVYTLDKF